MKKIVFALSFVAASLASSGAMAQAYVSGGLGFGHINVDCTGATACDNSNTAGKITGGFRFANNLAAELGYQSFGKASASDSTVSGDIKVDAWTLGVAYLAPINADFGFKARLGAASVKTKVDGTVVGVGSGSDSETKTKPYVGIGLNYGIAKNVKLELDADFTQASFAGENASVRSLTFGIRADF